MSHDLDITGLFTDENIRRAIAKCGVTLRPGQPITPALRRLGMARLSADLKRLMVKAQALVGGVEVNLDAPLPAEGDRP